MASFLVDNTHTITLDTDILRLSVRARQTKYNMADGRHIGNHFTDYLSAILSYKSEFWREDWESHCDTCHASRMANFKKIQDGGRLPF